MKCIKNMPNGVAYANTGGRTEHDTCKKLTNFRVLEWRNQERQNCVGP